MVKAIKNQPLEHLPERREETDGTEFSTTTESDPRQELQMDKRSPDAALSAAISTYEVTPSEQGTFFGFRDCSSCELNGGSKGGNRSGTVANVLNSERTPR